LAFKEDDPQSRYIDYFRRRAACSVVLRLCCRGVHMNKLVLALALLSLAACAPRSSHTRINKMPGQSGGQNQKTGGQAGGQAIAQPGIQQRDTLKLGSAPAKDGAGRISTCSLYALDKRNANLFSQVSGMMKSANLDGADCSLDKVVGVCATHSSGSVLIYTNIYYYAPAYNEAQAESTCKDAGGQFGGTLRQ
jgi:hypothetical protein